MFANKNKYVRVAHRVPDHDAVHVHVLPALQTPPFKQTGEQTAKRNKNENSRNTFSMLWWIFANENEYSTYVLCMLHHPN